MLGVTHKRTIGDLACVCTGAEEGEKVVLEGPSGGSPTGLFTRKERIKVYNKTPLTSPPPETNKQTIPEYTRCG